MSKAKSKSTCFVENANRGLVFLKNMRKKFFFFRKNVFVEEHGHIDIFKHYDYEKIKLFFLSILWRMSIAANDMFSEVSLGPHGKRIQKMLLAEKSIFSWDYPIFAVYPLFDRSKKEGIIMSPSFMKNDAHRLYRFVIGGICVFIAMNPEYARNCPTKPFLLTEEKFPLPKISAEKIMFINNWMATWQDLK